MKQVVQNNKKRSSVGRGCADGNAEIGWGGGSKCVFADQRRQRADERRAGAEEPVG